MAGQVITIGRQCGSGGHTIGEQAAKILGIPFYDRELIEMTAKESGFGKEFVEEQGEHRNSSVLYNLVKNLSYSRTMPSGKSEYLQDEIFFAQRKIITELAEKRTLCDRGTLCGFYSERNRKQSEYLYSCGKSI